MFLLLYFLYAAFPHFALIRPERETERERERVGNREEEEEEKEAEELSSRPVIRDDATLIILLFDGTRARGDSTWLQVDEDNQASWPPRSNEKSCVSTGGGRGASEVKIAWSAMNIQIEFLASSALAHVDFFFSLNLLETRHVPH